MGDIYTEILRAQVKQGNFGGKSGAFGYLAKKEKKEKEVKVKTPKPEKVIYPKSEYTFNLVSGTITYPADDNGLADGYIRLALLNEDLSRGKEIWHSRVVSKTLSPVWEQSATIAFRDNVKQIALELWDHDHLSANDFIGYTVINVGDIKNTGKLPEGEVLVFENVRDNKVRGTVKFSIDYKKSLAA